MSDTTCSHSEAWLMLPWLANGRLSTAERLPLEEHVQGCTQCAQELLLQRRLCEVLTEPERVTYAPGPSFRKLMDRIDGRTAAKVAAPRATWLGALAMRSRAAWRPPGLAWAASFMMVAGLLGVAATTYHWSQPLYVTHTLKPAPAAAPVLHVAFVPSLSITGVGEALRSAGARIVEGPDASGIIGVTPLAVSADGAGASEELRTLASRLRADARVRWVQPLPGVESAARTQRGQPQP